MGLSHSEPDVQNGTWDVFKNKKWKNLGLKV
jgi:hypothetical protein